MSDFQPLEVVGRGSETQLQVVENLNSAGFAPRCPNSPHETYSNLEPKFMGFFNCDVLF